MFHVRPTNHLPSLTLFQPQSINCPTMNKAHYQKPANRLHNSTKRHLIDQSPQFPNYFFQMSQHHPNLWSIWLFILFTCRICASPTFTSLSQRAEPNCQPLARGQQLLYRDCLAAHTKINQDGDAWSDSREQYFGSEPGANIHFEWMRWTSGRPLRKKPQLPPVIELLI